MSACIDRELAECASKAVARLAEKKLTIVTAESCTAGLISAALSQGEGAAKVLHGSFVTYTKDNKTMALGVSRELLEQKSSVNAEVAKQLACGALERSPADIALSVTGVLGPEPDEDGNPVGLVYLACCRRGGAPNVVHKDYGDRPHDELRRAVVRDALDLLLDCIA
jgi:nicotinamide-nucleotide amidase